MSVTALPLRRLVWPALLMLWMGLAGCTHGPSGGKTGQPQPPSSSTAAQSAAPDAAVAIVGDKTITRSEFTDRLIAGYGSEVLREMMVHEAVKLETAQLGITLSRQELAREIQRMSEGYESENDFYSSMMRQLGMNRDAVAEEARFRILEEKLATRDVIVSEADIGQYYQEHKQEYRSRKQYQLAWILTETKENAGAILSRLENGADFAELARQQSTDADTADNGGNLGWVDENDPFHEAVVLSAAGQLKIGEAAGPLKTDHGYAIVELNGLKSVKQKELADVQDEIRRLLAMERAKPIHEMEQSLLAKYDAKVLDTRLSGK